jgi:pimeloyl-ACP methyl ester carboxylesterase
LSLPSDTSALDHGLQQQGDDRRLLSTMSLWGPALIEQLAGQHQLLLFDNRGAGLSSDTAQNNTTIPQMADDGAGRA